MGRIYSALPFRALCADVGHGPLRHPWVLGALSVTHPYCLVYAPLPYFAVRPCACARLYVLFKGGLEPRGWALPPGFP